jgi:hypothetical protein
MDAAVAHDALCLGVLCGKQSQITAKYE